MDISQKLERGGEVAHSDSIKAQIQSQQQQRVLQDAVIRNFEIIGEAASRLSPALRNRAGFPWGKVIAFRNRLIHAYWSIDLALVWDVIEKDLPDLKADVERLRAQLSGSQSS